MVYRACVGTCGACASALGQFSGADSAGLLWFVLVKSDLALSTLAPGASWIPRRPDGFLLFLASLG